MNRREHTHSDQYLQVILLALLSAYFITFCIINFFGFHRFSTPDMYEDTVVARLMWEQKTLFPSGWVFGNQYYVVATPVLAALFYGITGSMNLAMALATSTMTLFILISFAWMVKPFVDRTQLFFGLLCLVSCILCFNAVNALEGQILYILASYYSCYIVTLFVVWGYYVRSLYIGARETTKAASAIALILAFCTGMQSLRQTAVMVIPLAGFELLRLLLIGIRTRAVPENKDWTITGKAAAVCLANITGWIFMKQLAIPNVSIYGQILRLPEEKYIQHAETNLRALRCISGLKYAAGNPSGIFATLFTTILIFMVLYFPARCILQRKATGNGLLCYALLSGISIIGLLAVNLMLDISLRSIYLFVWYPLVVFSAIGAAGTMPVRLKNAFILFFCMFSLGNLYLSYLPGAVTALRPDNSIEKQIAGWVEEKGYRLIYGEWYVITEVAPYTDGAVTAGSWFKEPYKVLPYINPLKVYSGSDNAKAVYMLRASEREKALRLAAERGAVLTQVASFENGACTLYTSSKQLMQKK